MRKLRDYALFLLNRRDYSAMELRDKCLAKGYEPEEVSTVVREFLENRWLDDVRYARTLVRQQAGAGKSRKQIQESLRRKGIDPEIAGEALGEEYPEDLEEELVDRLAEKYLRSSRPPSRQTLTARLVSRGFRYGVVKKCLDRRPE